MLPATSSATQVYTAVAPGGIAIARSKWHCNCSLRVALRLLLRVASQSRAVLDFRRLHGSNPHDFSSLKRHLGMGEDFSAKQQSKLQNILGADHRYFAFDAEVNGENDWGLTFRNGHVYAAIGTWAKIESFAKHAMANSFTWASCSFFDQRGSLLYNGLTKKYQECITLPSTTSDRQSVRVKRKNVCKSKA